MRKPTAAMLSKSGCIILACAILAGCASPQQAQVNRDNRLERQFPNPADRVGMFLVFASGSSFIVEYQPGLVGQDTVMSRMDGVCQRTGEGRVATLVEQSPISPRMTTLGNGTQVEVDSLKVRCVA